MIQLYGCISAANNVALSTRVRNLSETINDYNTVSVADREYRMSDLRELHTQWRWSRNQQAYIYAAWTNEETASAYLTNL